MGEKKIHHCPSCECGSMAEDLAWYKGAFERLQDDVQRLSNHVIGQDKLIAALRNAPEGSST